MSFDIKIVNGDLSFDEQGRAELVRNNDKLIQSVLKMISTTLGSDVFTPNYGLSITGDSIGVPNTATVTEQKLQAEIVSGLQQLQREQEALVQIQVLTPGERIRNIDYVAVEQDASDPRQFNISIELTTFEETPITVSTAIRG